MYKGDTQNDAAIFEQAWSISLVTDKGVNLGSAWKSGDREGIPDEWYYPFTFRVAGVGSHCGASSMAEALNGLIAAVSAEKTSSQTGNV